MARRPELELAFTDWLKGLGLRIRAMRMQVGWTQAQAAERLAIDYKYYQAIETGRASVTARTIFLISMGFGVDPSALMPAPRQPDRGPQERRPGGVVDLVAYLGGKLITPEPGQRPDHAVPVYDLSAVAGPLVGDARIPQTIAWVDADLARGKGEMFIAQIAGTSMEPKIADGAWCLFRQPASTPFLGKVLLLQMSDGTPDASGYQVKRVGALSLVDEDSTMVRVRLDSFNPAVAPIEVTADGESELLAIGEFVRVIAPPPR